MNKEAKAAYRKTGNLRYENNPYIESLPPMLSPREIMDLFYYQPALPENLQEMSKQERLKHLGLIDEFLAPFKIHLDLYQSFYTMVCDGYTHRNPMDKGRPDLKLAREGIESLSSQDYTVLNARPEKSICPSILVTGISGVGKTTTFDRILGTLPQVIYHESYQGKRLTRTQLPYLKVDCPYNAQLSTFCQYLLRGFDEALGIDIYERTALVENHGVNKMSSTIRTLIHNYALGCLVIDEIQNLVRPQSEDCGLLNFFVNIINDWKIPFIFIGTPKFLNVMQTNVRSNRRFNSMGNYVWTLPKEDSADWKTSLENLWEIQLTKNKTFLNQSLAATMFDLTQGNLAVASSLFKAVQRKLITNPEDLDEIITPMIIRQCFKESFSTYSGWIEAIRNNDLVRQQDYEDLVFLMLDNHTTTESKDKDTTQEELLELERINRKLKEEKLSNELLAYLTGQELYEYLTEDNFKDIVKDIIKSCGVREDIKVLKQNCSIRALDLEKALRELNERETRLNRKPILSARENASSNNTTVADELGKKGLKGLGFDQ